MAFGNIDFSAVVVRKRDVASELDRERKMARVEARRLVQSATMIFEAIEIDDFSGVVDEARQLKMAIEGVVARAEKVNAMRKLTYKR